MSDNIEISILVEHETVADFIIGLPLMTRSWLKKFKLKKAFLQSKADKGKTILLPIALLNKSQISPFYEGEEVRFLGECDGVYAFGKVINTDCYPLDYSNKQNTLSSIRKQGAFKNLIEFNCDNPQRGLLNRLDNVTSGVVLCTDSNEVMETFKNDRASVVLDKKYLAVTKEVSWKMRKVQTCIELTKSGPVKVKANEAANCEIDSEVLMSEDGYSLHLITLKEGRRHQIRAQLASVGFPIVGDVLYGTQESSRVFLHSLSYTIKLKNEHRFIDDSLVGFDLFFDVDRTLDMLRNKFGTF